MTTSVCSNVFLHNMFVFFRLSFFVEADSKVDSLSMHLTLIYRKRQLYVTLAMQRVETIRKCAT